MAAPLEWKININDQAEIDRLNQRLDKGPTALLKSFGVILARESKDAFTKQAFGETKWKPRYPNQSGAKLNIAGALMDLGKGPKIKERRFQDRPAVMDTGMLKNSIASTSGKENAGEFFVKCGSMQPYANKQHQGGVSKIRITEAMRVNFAEVWDRFKAGKVGGKKGTIGSTVALRRIAFLRNSNVTEYSVKIVPRPFIGITAQALKDIEQRLADWTMGT